MITDTGDVRDGSGDTDVLVRELHDALVHLRDLPIQGTHPLGTLIGQPSPLAPIALRQLLLDAIERLRPPSHVEATAPRWRRYRYLRLRYVEGAPLAQVCAALGIGERQARREHRAALQELAGLLLDPTSRSARNPTAEVILDATLHSPETESGETRPVASDDAGLDAELGQIEPSLEPIDLPAAFEDALRLIERLAASHSVKVQLLRGDGPVIVLATRTILRQILLNLLSYLIGLPNTRRIQITLSETGASAEACLLANGEEAPDGSTPSPALAAARRLAEGEQGSLRIEPTGDGVMARLLLLTNQASIVLVVDDNPDLIRLFRRYLRGEGFRLLQARNAIRAQQLARSLRPDVIVLDLMMPVQDGWDFLHAMQSDPTTTGIPIVACSVLPERELALSLQVSDFLAKPVTPEALLKALEPYRRTLQSTREAPDAAAARRDSP